MQCWSCAIDGWRLGSRWEAEVGWEWTGEMAGWVGGQVRSRVGEAQRPCCLLGSWGVGAGRAREPERRTGDPATRGAWLYRAGAGTVRGEIKGPLCRNGGVSRGCCWAWSDWNPGWRLGETVAVSYVRLKPWLDRWSGNESPVRGEMHGARQLSVQGAKVLVFERAIASTYKIWTSVLVRVRQALDPNVGATTLWHCAEREATRKRRESRDSITRWTVVRSSARPALQFATCHADSPAMTLTGLEYG